MSRMPQTQTDHNSSSLALWEIDEEMRRLKEALEHNQAKVCTSETGERRRLKSISFIRNRIVHLEGKRRAVEQSLSPHHSTMPQPGDDLILYPLQLTGYCPPEIG